MIMVVIMLVVVFCSRVVAGGFGVLAAEDEGKAGKESDGKE
jgi:hypothetical protein